MKNHRFLTFTGAGSLVAAVLAFSFLIVVPSQRSTVEAKTIFNSLREALNSAFEVTIEDLSIEGLHIDGRVGVVLDGDADAIKPLNAPPRGAYLEMAIRADDTADPDVAGADIKVAAALTQGNEWAFVRITALPPAVLEEAPPVAFLANFARDGLLLDLDGLLDDDPLRDIFGDVTISNESPASAEKNLALSISGGASSTAPGQQSGEDDVQIDVNVRSEKSVLTPDGNHIDPNAFEQLPQRLLTGQATASELENLITLLESAAEQATIAEVEPGLHVLTVSGLDIDDDDIEGEILLGNAVLQVAYREGAGVEWLRIDHLGVDDGRILVEMTDLTTDHELFSRERFLADPKVTRFDLAGLLNFFEKKQ